MPAQSVEVIYLVRPNSGADESKYFNKGPTNPATAASPRVLRSVVPAMYKAKADDKEALSHDKNTCFIVSP